MHAEYEASKSFGYIIGARLGDMEFSVTAHPGSFLHDANCRSKNTNSFRHMTRTDRHSRPMAINTSKPWNYSAHQLQTLS